MSAIAEMKMSMQSKEDTPRPMPLLSNQLPSLINNMEKTAANATGIMNSAAKYKPAKTKKKNNKI